MGAKRITAGSIVFLLSVAGVWGAEKGESLSAVTTAVSTLASSASPRPSTEAFEIEAWIHTRMNDLLRERIEVGFEIAAERVREVESCSDLFAELGVDALATMAEALYWPVKSRREVKDLCGGRNLAFTVVGSRMTFVCPDFEEVSDQRAAQVIIHEALHNAGLKERPQYRGRDIKTAREIDSMVAENCRF